MLCCAVLCCAVLCCAVLYCAVLCCAVLYCAVLSCTVLYCTVLYCTVLYCRYGLPFPAVLKLGTAHAGMGKIKVESERPLASPTVLTQAATTKTLGLRLPTYRATLSLTAAFAATGQAALTADRCASMALPTHTGPLINGTSGTLRY